MPRIYCIPGLGTDRRIFDKLAPLLSIQDIHFLEHLPPLHLKETLVEYARRLSRTIENHPIDSVVIGMSLGGMIAVELSKLLPFRKVFLISTIKHHTEHPWYFSALQKLPIQNLASHRLIRAFTRPVTWLLRVTDRTGRTHLQNMVNDRDDDHFKWGHNAAIHWRNTDFPEDCIHIHGSKDELFPMRSTRPHHTIKHGNHYMIMDRADEIASIINDELNRLFLPPPPQKTDENNTVLD